MMLGGCDGISEMFYGGCSEVKVVVLYHPDTRYIDHLTALYCIYHSR